MVLFPSQDSPSPKSPAAPPPSAANPTITDADLADIATYIRNEWSNKAPLVKPEDVTRLRKETTPQAGRPYTAKDLGME